MRKVLAVAGLLALVGLTAAPQVGQAQKPTKISGVIAGRSGADMMVRTATGTTTVTLNSTTKVEEKKGALKLKHSSMAMTSLIPGLKVEVDGTPGPNNSLVATTVKFTCRRPDHRQRDRRRGESHGAAGRRQRCGHLADQQAIAKNAQGVAANAAGEDSLKPA